MSDSLRDKIIFLQCVILKDQIIFLQCVIEARVREACDTPVWVKGHQTIFGEYPHISLSLTHTHTKVQLKFEKPDTLQLIHATTKR